MIYRIPAQELIANPIEQAQRKLRSHQENGTSSSLSIFEVAKLMDQIMFSHPSVSKPNNGAFFELCFN